MRPLIEQELNATSGGADKWSFWWWSDKINMAFEQFFCPTPGNWPGLFPPAAEPQVPLAPPRPGMPQQ